MKALQTPDAQFEKLKRYVRATGVKHYVAVAQAIDLLFDQNQSMIRRVERAVSKSKS